MGVYTVFTALCLAVLCTLGLGAYEFYIYMNQTCIIKTSRVINVGGCDRYGTCSAMLENGRISYVQLPVVGQEITYKKCE